MSGKYSPVTVGKEGVSDDFYTVVRIFYKDGDKVEEDDILLTFETSKAAIDFPADADGYFFSLVAEGDEIVVGDTIAVIAEEESFDKSGLKSESPPSSSVGDSADMRVSKPAQRLMDEHGLTLEDFPGSELISKDDVEAQVRVANSNVDLSSLEVRENSVLILGGGGHAKMCIDIIRQQGALEPIGIIDTIKTPGEGVFGIPVLGGDEVLQTLRDKGVKLAVLGVGAVLNHSVREKLHAKLMEHGFQVPNIIHPSASIEPSVELGDGNQIMQGAIIGSAVTIGDNCIVNSGSVISHDSSIAKHVHIAPGAVLAGGVQVGAGSVVGMGSTVFLGVQVGQNVMINNGVHIFDDVASDSIVKQ